MRTSRYAKKVYYTDEFNSVRTFVLLLYEKALLFLYPLIIIFCYNFAEQYMKDYDQVIFTCLGSMIFLPLLGIFVIQPHKARIRQTRLWLLASQDTRLPFILLNSFEQNDLYFGDTTEVLLTEHQSTYSEYLVPKFVDGVNRFGRLIHLKNFLDGLRKESTLVILSKQNEWERLFHFLAEESRAIFIIPERTPGIIKEMKYFQANNLLYKSIIIMPPAIRGKRNWLEVTYPANYRDTWEELKEELKNKHLWNLPDYDRNGKMYIPNSDYSERFSCPFEAWSSEIMIRNMIRLLSIIKTNGTGLKDLIPMIPSIVGNSAVIPKVVRNSSKSYH